MDNNLFKSDCPSKGVCSLQTEDGHTLITRYSKMGVVAKDRVRNESLDG